VMSETRYVHVCEVNMNLIKKRAIRLYQLEQVVERIRCSANCLQEVVVRVVEVID
jgi:hypothetical protein